jgi:hypothetical protein
LVWNLINLGKVCGKSKQDKYLITLIDDIGYGKRSKHLEVLSWKRLIESLKVALSVVSKRRTFYWESLTSSVCLSVQKEGGKVATFERNI